MKRLRKRILLIAWTSLCIAVLYIVLVGFDGQPNSDAAIVLIYLMTVLTFPAGLLVILLLGGLYTVLEWTLALSFSVSYLSLLVHWTIFFGAGYLQWFRLMPWLATKVKLFRDRRAHLVRPA
jgi:hypothetical protein